MTPTTLLFGQVLVVFAVVLSGVWAATQLVAGELGFQARLGAPWFVLGAYPVYPPHRFFAWWYLFDAYAPATFLRGGFVAAGGGALGAATAIAGSLWRAR